MITQMFIHHKKSLVDKTGVVKPSKFSETCMKYNKITGDGDGKDNVPAHG